MIRGQGYIDLSHQASFLIQEQQHDRRTGVSNFRGTYSPLLLSDAKLQVLAKTWNSVRGWSFAGVR